jgi:hypothetical protein
LFPRTVGSKNSFAFFPFPMYNTQHSYNLPQS